MAWESLLQTAKPIITAPWVGGRSVWLGSQSWEIRGSRPVEHCWGRFECDHRKAKFVGVADPDMDILSDVVRGYLVGDRIVSDYATPISDLSMLLGASEQVFLVEPGLDRFARISAARATPFGPLIYRCLEMPLGPEQDVLRAFQDRQESVRHIPGVMPGLDAAFRLETEQRAEVERRRAELQRQLREEQERLEREERTRELVKRMGDGAGRREMALVDFAQAAKAALAVGGAEYLDHIRSPNPHEMRVQFRYQNRRFECLCHDRTLRIIDAGICLDDHRQERGDTRFTLESLPSVINEAVRTRRLHVTRRPDDEARYYDDDQQEDWDDD